MPTPSQPAEVAEFVTEKLMSVRGVSAITSLGSQENGITRFDALTELVVLYRNNAPLNMDDLQDALNNCDDLLKPVVGAIGSAGPWLNGTAQCKVGGNQVHISYRSIDAINTVIANADDGQADHDWLQHPPYGFSSIAYMGEIDVCEVLFDPKDVVSSLKQDVRPYPRALKSNLVNGFLWGAETTVRSCVSAAERNDIYTARGASSRAAAMLAFTMFALNDRYYISDRGALEVLATFPMMPQHCHARLLNALSELDPEAALKQLMSLVEETKAIVRSMPSLQVSKL